MLCDSEEVQSSIALGGVNITCCHRLPSADTKWMTLQNNMAPIENAGSPSTCKVVSQQCAAVPPAACMHASTCFTRRQSIMLPLFGRRRRSTSPMSAGLTTTLGLTCGRPPTCCASTSLSILASCGVLLGCLNLAQVKSRDLRLGTCTYTGCEAHSHGSRGQCRGGRGRHPGFGAGSSKRHLDRLWVTGGHRRRVCCPLSQRFCASVLKSSCVHLRPLTHMPVTADAQRLAAQCCAEWLQ